MAPPHLFRTRKALTALLLSMLLVTAQALGLAHRITHADGPPTTTAHVTASHDALATAFDGHDDRHDCWLYDQLQLADVLCMELPVVAALLGDPPVPTAAGGRQGLAPPQGYQARAPPPVA